MYDDGQFVRHPILHSTLEMQWCALQADLIYVHQHPHDTQLSVEELHDMVGHEGEAFSNRGLYYAASL